MRTSSGYLASTGSFTTLTAGWEQHFTLEWVAEAESGGVNGFGRAYFAVAQMPAADKYRVTVWDYTWLQTDDNRR
jgi:hypothetical protein